MIDPGREIRQEIIGAVATSPIKETLGGAFRGALWGGGIAGAAQLAGVGGTSIAAGAIAGAAMGGLASAALSLIPIWERLSRVSLTLVDSLAAVHPVYRAMSRIAGAQERTQGFQWGEAIRPLMEKWFAWSMEFQRSWTDLKIALYHAVAPLLKGLLNSIIALSPAIIGLANIAVGFIGGLVKAGAVIMRLVDILDKIIGMFAKLAPGGAVGERMAHIGLTAALAGGMTYALTRSPYLAGRVALGTAGIGAALGMGETAGEEAGGIGALISAALTAWGIKAIVAAILTKGLGVAATTAGPIGWIVGGSIAALALAGGQGALSSGPSFGQGGMSRGAAGTPSLTQTIGGATANVTVQVQDHTELTRAFEEAWSKIRRTLMEREAEMVISSMRLRESIL